MNRPWMNRMAGEDPGVRLAPAAQALMLIAMILLGLAAVTAAAIAVRTVVGIFS